MAVRVKFMSFLSEVTGVSECVLEEPCRTLEDAMKILLERFPALAGELFDESGNLDYVYQIILNGSRVEWPGDKKTPLSGGDEIMFLAFLGGG